MPSAAVSAAPRRLAPGLLVLTAGAPALAQAAPDPPAAAADRQRVVVTANRTEQDSFDAPRAIDSIDAEALLQGNFRSLPQALRNLPSTMLQETSPGQGSPFLRGFTGYYNLLLIDGIRLNNSTFRSGPNQYWATIDVMSVDRVEVLRGVASTAYGSDAIGGTVQVFTRSPDRYGPDGVQFGGRSFARYATAENSPAVRGEATVGVTREGGLHTGFLVGGTARHLGDIEGGRATGTQPETGFDETGFDAKVEHWLDQRTRLVFLHQQFDQDAVPRTHSTVFGQSWRGTQVGTDLQRDNDQRRTLTYLQLHRTGLDGPVQSMRWSVSWQTQREVQDRIRGNGAQTLTEFDVGTFGAFAQFDSATAIGRLTYGIDWYHDNVNSWLRRSGTPLASDPIQGAVANDASYDLVGVFVQDVLPITADAALEAGVRYNYARADADSVRDPTGNRIALENSWNAVTANLHLLVGVAPGWKVYGGVSQGFRAPTLSDLTSFEIARSGEQEIPATDLSEERFVGFEVGTKIRSSSLTGQLAYYYTRIEDQIQRFPTGDLTPAGDRVVTKANIGKGYIHGVELQYGWQMLPFTTLFGVHSWQYGRVSNFEGPGSELADDYPSRLMPLTNVLGIRWEDEQGRWHVLAEVVRAEDADKLSFADQRDLQRIPPGGTASYTLCNVRGGYRVDDRTSIEIAVENLTDVDYRVHGSGSNNLGRNFVFGLQVLF